jgi:hypothetical protein
MVELFETGKLWEEPTKEYGRDDNAKFRKFEISKFWNNIVEGGPES